jgi:hypothetical protein
VEAEQVTAQNGSTTTSDSDARSTKELALGSLIAGGVFGVTSGTLFAISLAKDTPRAAGDRSF